MAVSNAEQLSFESWMRAVDAALLAMCGMDSGDLADCAYSDMYEDGMSAKAAAKQAVRENGGDF